VSGADARAKAFSARIEAPETERQEGAVRLVETALDLHRRDSMSWWDSLIIAAAIRGGCDRILNEDSQHGRKIRGIKVLNPFRPVSPTVRK
jgi:predicted nucleic acid-binding protein